MLQEVLLIGSETIRGVEGSKTPGNTIGETMASQDERHDDVKEANSPSFPSNKASPQEEMPAIQAPPAAVASEDSLIVGTEKWDRLNHRRGELIFKQVRQGLTPQEEEEYQRLQRMCLAALEKAFPAPPLDEARLERLEEKLGAAEASP